MSLNRYAKRRDANESEILKDLRRCGYLVRQQDFPDVALRKHGWPDGMVQLLEINGITKNRQRSEKQKQFLQAWSIPTIASTEEALSVLQRLLT